jgi:hypothetical protein
MARTYRHGFDRFGERPPRWRNRLESDDTPLWDEDLDDEDGDGDDELWDDGDEDWDDGDRSHDEE